ncbi:MAG: polysaccharide biosynthesis/export family protein [Bacteroidales bacterium]|nr:polysaccharide biosynthesis/export family protein [Bacteroidales bacterium]
MKAINKVLLVAFCATIALSSCVTPSQVNYLQDMRHGSQIELENKFQAIISPYDELDIYVFGPSDDEKLLKPFNISSSTIGGSSINRRGAYLVDVNGNIQFPVLGEVHVAGLTRLQLQDSLRIRLEKDGLLHQPVVIARFANFKIFFLGAEGGKSITISNERCTFLEALALCGDLSVYTNRNKIAVMREIDGKMVMRYLDPRSSSVFQDPFFMLQQNDFIITQNYNTSTTRTEARNFVSMWVSTAMSTITLALTIINLVNRSKN